MTPQRYRQLRGLLHHFRENQDEITRAKTFRRGLFRTFRRRQGNPGRCRWCQLPTRGKATWHKPCVGAYRTACGQAVTRLWRRNHRPPCTCGRPGTELDHQDALVLAWTSGDTRRLIRAHTLENLIWLCRPCHLRKTQQDLQQLGEMRAGHVCLAGTLWDSPDPGMGTSHWALAHGGLVMNPRGQEPDLTGLSQTTRRRIRFTQDPRKTSCPRCLTALRHRDQSEEGRFPAPNLLGLRPNWVLDESSDTGEDQAEPTVPTYQQATLWPA